MFGIRRRRRGARSRGGSVELRTIIAYALIALIIAVVLFVARRIRNSRKERSRRRRFFY
jgi:hypothetical protein